MEWKNMSNKKKTKRPQGDDLHKNDRNISREMKKSKQKNLWSKKK